MADKNYYSGLEIKACKDAGMNSLVPRSLISTNKKKGLFTKDDFTYDAKLDVYICPAKRQIPYSFDTTDRGKIIRGYVSINTCKGCAIKSQRTLCKTLGS